MIEKLTKTRKRLCRALSGAFDNLRYVDSYGERYFLASMVCAMGFLALVFYIMATQPVGLFPPMEPDVAACSKLQRELPFLSCEPEKIEMFYEARRKLSRLMRPAKTGEVNGWLGFAALFLLLATNIFTLLFRTAGDIEAHNKRKRGVLPDPVAQWQKETYGEPGRIMNALETFYNWSERCFKRLEKSPLMPRELPEPEPERQIVEWVEAEFLAQLDSTMAQNVSNPDFSVHDLASGAGGISKSKLSTRLRELLDCTPGEYIISYRMSRARQLLIKGGSVCDVKKGVGYKDSKSFCDAFRDHSDMTPGRYAKGHACLPKKRMGRGTKKGGNRPNP